MWVSQLDPLLDAAEPAAAQSLNVRRDHERGNDGWIICRQCIEAWVAVVPQRFEVSRLQRTLAGCGTTESMQSHASNAMASAFNIRVAPLTVPLTNVNRAWHTSPL